VTGLSGQQALSLTPREFVRLVARRGIPSRDSFDLLLTTQRSDAVILNGIDVTIVRSGTAPRGVFEDDTQGDIGVRSVNVTMSPTGGTVVFAGDATQPDHRVLPLSITRGSPEYLALTINPGTCGLCFYRLKLHYLVDGTQHVQFVPAANKLPLSVASTDDSMDLEGFYYSRILGSSGEFSTTPYCRAVLAVIARQVDVYSHPTSANAWAQLTRATKAAQQTPAPSGYDYSSWLSDWSQLAARRSFPSGRDLNAGFGEDLGSECLPAVATTSASTSPR
jgi:hypothetical protein